MKEQQRIVSFDAREENAVISILNDKRNQEIADRQSSDLTGDLILKIIRAPVKKVRVRDEAR
jgi:hypothetical protein